MITEADTCRKYVLPKLIQAGWENPPHSITEQKTFTDGRIVVTGNKIKRRPQKRAGVVVPNGTLFGDGVCARIKEELLKEFNLHTIVRLPNGVFAPYTSIPTNLIFFDRSGPTREIWYYEHPLPEGRKNYTKTQPLQYEEFAPCLAWWANRVENERAWKVSVNDVLKYDESGNLISANLDIKNPNSKGDFEHLPPEQLVDDILAKEQRIAEIMAEIKQILAEGTKQ